MLGQHRQLTDDQGQLTIALLPEGEAHLARAHLLYLSDIGVVAAIEGVALFFQGVEGPDDILHLNGVAIMKAGLWAQGVGHPGAVLGGLDGLGHQAVDGEGLVIGAYGEGIEQAGDAGGGHALENEGVEVVEGANLGQAHLASLGGLGVGIVKMAKVRGVLHRSMHGQSMAGLRGGAGIE